MSPVSYHLVPPSGEQVSKAAYNSILTLSLLDFSVLLILTASTQHYNG